MEETWADDYLIDQFLNERLSEQEAEAFEKRKADPDFLSRLKSSVDIGAALNEKGRAQLKKRFNELDKNERMSSQKQAGKNVGRQKSSQGRLWLLAAAAIIVLLIYFLMPGESTEVDYRQTLLAEHYQPFPNVIDPIVKGEEKESNNPFQAYELGDYARAIKAFESKTPMNFNERLYCGLSYLAMGNAKKAVDTLAPLRDSQNPNFKDQADWYYALALVGNKQFDAAIAVLQEMMEDQDHSYYTEAEDLFNDLN